MTNTVSERRPVAGRPAATQLSFYFDPLCPWAWRTSTWIREVQRHQPLDVRWRFFSLAIANDLDRDLVVPLRVAALLDRQEGNETVGRFYEALGTLIHEDGADAREPGALENLTRQALGTLDLDRHLADRALDDPTTLDEVMTQHQEARERFGAYGVPWLVIGDHDFGFNGPIIDRVPRGQAALDFWEHISWVLAQPYFYEIKRNRNQPAPARRRRETATASA